MKPQHAICVVGICLLTCGAPTTLDAPATPTVAGDLEAVAGEILATFERADLVCLGENHGSLQDAAVREAVVGHPEFAERVDVVVVEFANPLHQPLLDRLVLDDDDHAAFPREKLAPIWRDAGLGTMWELPQYERFLRAVADANRHLPAEHRVRVVGAALPVDWRAVETAEDLVGLPDRLDHFERVLRREILEPGRKGLAIFGVGHCEKLAPSVLSRLDPRRVFTVAGFDGAAGLAAGRAAFDLSETPELIRISGTSASEQTAGHMLFEGHAERRLGEIVDALVHLGAETSDTVLEPPRLAPEIQAELDRRARLWDQAFALRQKHADR